MNFAYGVFVYRTEADPVYFSVVREIPGSFSDFIEAVIASVDYGSQLLHCGARSVSDDRSFKAAVQELSRTTECANQSDHFDAQDLEFRMDRTLQKRDAELLPALR